jgi:glucose/arabinose dehydrogenase
MQYSGPFRVSFSALVAIVAIYVGSSFAPTRNHSKFALAAEAQSQACQNDDSGLKLPAGFCATVFADGIGHARHMVVAPSGVLYVNTWSGRYYGNDTPHAGGFLVALQDKGAGGKADVIERFGETVQTGGHGGTGIGMYKDAIYAEINDRIVRYSFVWRRNRAGRLRRDHGLRIAVGRRPSDASVHY